MAPIDVMVKTPARDATTTWQRAGDGHWIFTVSMAPGANRIGEITFPGTGDDEDRGDDSVKPVEDRQGNEQRSDAQRHRPPHRPSPPILSAH